MYEPREWAHEKSPILERYVSKSGTSDVIELYWPDPYFSQLGDKHGHVWFWSKRDGKRIAVAERLPDTITTLEEAKRAAEILWRLR